MSKFVKYVLTVIITISFLFCLWLPLHGELIIQTDIARDFLLLEEIVQKHTLPLIGAHSGIAGIYHGPLWFYINLPFFILGRGNPAVVGFFWVILYGTSLLILFYAAKKLFNKEIALLATALYALVSIQEVNNLSNPYGALMLFPLFFLWFYTYLRNFKFRYLLLAFLILGLIIQFQMAFGIPVLMLSVVLLVFLLFRKHKLTHFSSLLILLFTQSPSLLFELRHHFLQYHAFLTYLKNHNAPSNVLNINVLINQIMKTGTDGLVFFTKNNLYLNVIFFLSVLLSLLYIWKKKQLEKKPIYVLFFYFYFGFWFMMLFYHGQIWIYYHWAFIPVLIILFCSTYQFINKKVFYLLFFIFMGILFVQQVNRFNERNNYMGVTQASWKFIESSTNTVYTDAKGDFGYYVVSDDQLGYQTKYAFHYLQQFHKNKAFAYEKKPITYAYVVPSSDLGYSADNFVKQRVKILSSPVKIIKFKNGVIINKYVVSGDDLNVPSDPNLLNSLIFR